MVTRYKVRKTGKEVTIVAKLGDYYQVKYVVSGLVTMVSTADFRRRFKEIK